MSESEKSLMDVAVKKTGFSPEKIQETFSTVLNYASNSQENFGRVLNSYDKTMDVLREREITKREIRKYEKEERVAIEEIQQKYSNIRSIFSELFAERRTAINKDLEIIDKGLRENDYTLINMGLTSLSQVVTTSPFAELGSFHKMLESKDDQVIEL